MSHDRPSIWSYLLTRGSYWPKNNASELHFARSFQGHPNWPYLARPNLPNTSNACVKTQNEYSKSDSRRSSQKLHYPGQAGAPVEIIFPSGELPRHQIWNAITAASLSSPPSFLISWRFNTRGRWPASQQKQVCLEQITPRVEEYWSMGPGANHHPW